LIHRTLPEGKGFQKHRRFSEQKNLRERVQLPVFPLLRSAGLNFQFIILEFKHLLFFRQFSGFFLEFLKGRDCFCVDAVIPGVLLKYFCYTREIINNKKMCIFIEK
jgi:hypothetical protein